MSCNSWTSLTQKRYQRSYYRKGKDSNFTQQANYLSSIQNDYFFLLKPFFLLQHFEKGNHHFIIWFILSDCLLFIRYLFYLLIVPKLIDPLPKTQDLIRN